MNKFSGPLARRYGTALFECGLDAVKKGTSFNEFVEITRVLASFFTRKMTGFFVNPTLSLEEKLILLDTVLEKILEGRKIPLELKEFLKLMLENHRFSEIQPVLKNFLLRADEHIGVARATISSATKLSESGQAEFSSVLESVLNKKIILESKIDESLRSGFVIKVGNTNVDASLRSRLLNLKESLS